MKQLLSIVLLLYCSTIYAQQTPQYIQSLPSNCSNYFCNGSPYPFAEWSGINYRLVRKQTLYRTLEFPTVPSGMITRLYYKAYLNSIDTAWYRNLTIQMGYMPIPESGGSTDTFTNFPLPLSWYSTDTVFYAPVYTFGHVDTGDWIPLTLQTPFYYDASRNFIIDISQDSMNTALIPPSPLNLCSFHEAYRSYINTYSGFVSAIANVEIIGFDIQPNSVNDVNGISDLHIYPNPGHGVFTLRFHAAMPVSNAEIILTNLTGNIVKQEKYQNISGQFSKQIDISSMAKGIYFVMINTDGARVVKKLVLQ